jgi:hypothetical protein
MKMRKFFILMVLLVFSTSFALSCHAHTYFEEGDEIDPDIGTTELYYIFHISEEQDLTYNLKLDGVEKKTGETPLVDTIYEDNAFYLEHKTYVTLDVSDMLAGEHKATSSFTTDLCSIDSEYLFKILPDIDLALIDPPTIVHLYDDTTELFFEVENNGNCFTELLPEISVPNNRVTFEWPSGLHMGGKGRITLSLTKPIDTGIYEIKIKGACETEQETVIEYPIKIINPIFNLTVDEYNTTLHENTTDVSIKLKNSGNIPLDVSFYFQIADLSGGEEELFVGEIAEGETKEFNFTIPVGEGNYWKERLTGLTVKYKSGNETNSLEPLTFKTGEGLKQNLGDVGGTLFERAKRNKIAIASLLTLLGASVVILLVKKRWS